MIAAGSHVKVIADQTGHSDGGALILKRYGYLDKGRSPAGGSSAGIACFRRG
jgi:hypothetical protein